MGGEVRLEVDEGGRDLKRREASFLLRICGAGGG